MTDAEPVSAEEVPSEASEESRPPEQPRGLSAIPISPPDRRTRPGVRLEEARPWVAFNSDGSMNPGGYGYSATLEVTLEAHRLAVFHVRDLRERDEDAAGISMAQVKSLARTLLHAADRVQAGLRSDGREDRTAPSHKQARQCIREALWMLPVPWGATEEDRTAWSDDLAEYAGVLARMAAQLYLEP